MLELVPLSHREAFAFVEDWHRHNLPPRGIKFALGASKDRVLVGVVCVGRPLARRLQDGHTLEVTRTCTDGTRNVNSFLYAAAWRATRALGYSRLVTYTQAGETGSSLRGAGWRIIGERPARPGWDAPSRPRDGTSYLSTDRMLWEAAP